MPPLTSLLPASRDLLRPPGRASISRQHAAIYQRIPACGVLPCRLVMHYQQTRGQKRPARMSSCTSLPQGSLQSVPYHGRRVLNHNIRDPGHLHLIHIVRPQ